MDLSTFCGKKPAWREIAEGIVFPDGRHRLHFEEAEERPGEETLDIVDIPGTPRALDAAPPLDRED